MKKQRTEALWRACFTDTDEFIRLFFDKVYRDENALVIEKQGQLVAALHLLPYTIRLHGAEFPASYICGVSTHPNERGKGLMKQLMLQAEEELKHRNIPLAMLIPAETWLFDIYRKYGYSEAFSYGMQTYFPEQAPAYGNIRISIAEATANGLYAFFNQKLRERKACVLHTEADFDIIRKDLAISGGKLLIATNIRHEVVGMAFTLPEEKGKSAFITEFLFDNTSVKEQLLYATSQLYNVAKINYRTLPEATSCHPKGMAKIIDNNYFQDNGIAIQTLFENKQGYMTLMLD